MEQGTPFLKDALDDEQVSVSAAAFDEFNEAGNQQDGGKTEAPACVR